MRPWKLLEQLHEQGWLVDFEEREVHLRTFKPAKSSQGGMVVVSYRGHGENLQAMLENAAQKMWEGEGLQPLKRDSHH